MGKISPVSAKYVIHANIQIQGSVDKPDVIGAIFGQTEGLLGSDLELRELQRTGKVARIEVRLDIKEGKTSGEIIIPCSMDKAETAVIAASLETIERIGPCDSRVRVEKLEDIRISKRDFVINRAKELLAQFTKENPSDFNIFISQLMGTLNLEKQEDEKSVIFETRFMGEIKKVLSF